MQRFELLLPPEAISALNELSAASGISRAAVIRRAIGVLQTAESRAPGAYVGVTRDRAALDIVLIGAKGYN